MLRLAFERYQLCALPCTWHVAHCSIVESRKSRQPTCSTVHGCVPANLPRAPVQEWFGSQEDFDKLVSYEGVSMESGVCMACRMTMVIWLCNVAAQAMNLIAISRTCHAA